VLRRGPASLLVAMVLGMFATPALAAIAGSGAGDPQPLSDHIGGSFTVCGRLTAFTAPALGTPGEMTVAGVVGGADHDFPISDTAAVDPLVAGLAAAGEWHCLDLMGDGMGVITSIVVVTSTSSQCGVLAEAGGLIVQQESPSHEFTTMVLDGTAGTIIAADAALEALLHAIATVNPPTPPVEACVDLTFGPAGTLSALAVDYEEPGGGMAPLACGLVDGTPLDYRDPASQPYPEADIISVDGFEIDAGLIDAPYQAVLAFDLDAGLPACLIGRVVDSAIVGAAVFSPTDDTVCGTLEVIGGLVFVDAVVVSQALTSINFAEPTPNSFDLACATAFADEGVAAGTLDVCGSLDGIGASTFTISGVTFHLTGSVTAGQGTLVGTTGAFSLVGPFPFAPFGPANPATVAITTLGGCAGPAPEPSTVPDTSATVAGTSVGATLALFLAVVALSGAVALATVRIRRH
jgi:hypothetical protein